MLNLTIITKYIFISTILVGIFVLWDENQILKQNNQVIMNELENQKISLKNQSEIIKQQAIIIKSNNQKINNDKNTTIIKQINNVKRIIKNDNISKSVEDKNGANLLLKLPEEERKYTSVIPKIDFKDIELSIKDIDRSGKSNEQSENLKINPEVFIDKETKRFDGAKISIEKKF